MSPFKNPDEISIDLTEKFLDDPIKNNALLEEILQRGEKGFITISGNIAKITRAQLTELRKKHTPETPITKKPAENFFGVSEEQKRNNHQYNTDPCY